MCILLIWHKLPEITLNKRTANAIDAKKITLNKEYDKQATKKTSKNVCSSNQKNIAQDIKRVIKSSTCDHYFTQRRTIY